MRCRISVGVGLLCAALSPLAAQRKVPGSTLTAANLTGNKLPESGGLGPAAGSPTLNALDDFSQTVQKLIGEVSPAVVEVVVQSFGKTDSDPGDRGSALGRQTREGTAVFVSADGYLITNSHVVESAHKVQIRVGEGTDSGKGPARQGLISADIVGIDKDTDLAVLKVEGTDWRYLPFADSARLRKGEIVFAVGSPRGLDNSVSMGVVSAVERQLNADSSLAFIQTDAPINPGNSGGPLVNTHGEIAGINTFIFTSSGGSEGLGFAIPSSFVKDVYSQIRRNGRVRRGELGVIARTVTPPISHALSLPSESGVLIQDVIPGKAAASAGLQMGDVVVSVQGRTIGNLRQFSSNLFRSEIGENLKLEVLRNQEKVQLVVALQEPAADDDRMFEKMKERAVPITRIGVLAVPLDKSTTMLVTGPRHDYGTIVAAKLQTSRVFQEDLEPGDVIYAVNGARADDIEALNGLLTNVGAGNALVIQVQRQGLLRYVVLNGD